MEYSRNRYGFRQVFSEREVRVKKILFVQWNAFMQKGMENALRRLKGKLNIEYENFFYDFKDWDNDNVFCRLFEKKLMGGKITDKERGAKGA